MSILQKIRQFPAKSIKKSAPGAELPGEISKEIMELQDEIKFLTSYSSDTIYRLRYDTMNYDYISPSIVRLLGFTEEEVKRLNFRSLILETRIVTSGMKKVDSFAELEKRRKSGDVNKWQADYLVRTRDGRKIWISDISYPWFDEDGKIIGSVGTLRDITERIGVEEKVREELAKIAHTDVLTDLANRREFFTRLDGELKRINRTHSEVSVIIADIDHFKKVNDAFGHATGDQVLMEIAGVIKSCLRDTDLAARLGGEEFGILLPETPMEGAFWVAERIRLAIAKHNFTAGDKQMPLGVTVSLGVASATAGESLDCTELYKMADTRLYIAKNTGRNQVSIDEIDIMH